MAAWVSSFAGHLPGSRVTTGHPNRRSFFRFGFCPVYASKGVFPIARCGIQFLRYTAWIRAHDQYSGPKFALWSSVRIILASVLFGLSATPFWKEASGAMGCGMYPICLAICWNAKEPQSSLSSSVRMNFWLLVLHHVSSRNQSMHGFVVACAWREKPMCSELPSRRLWGNCYGNREWWWIIILYPIFGSPQKAHIHLEMCAGFP